ncbi:LPXTG cell wall anchor domain-containing protein [Cohnella sp. GCM10027633]
MSERFVHMSYIIALGGLLALLLIGLGWFVYHRRKRGAR